MPHPVRGARVLEIDKHFQSTNPASRVSNVESVVIATPGRRNPSGTLLLVIPLLLLLLFPVKARATEAPDFLESQALAFAMADESETATEALGSTSSTAGAAGMDDTESSVLPSSPADALREANSAFQSGDYGLAARRYRAILDSGVVNEDLLFNLGTAELRAGRRGHAILAFEGALRLAPGDEDVLFNLNEARRGNIDRVVGERVEIPLLERLGKRLPAEPIGYAFAVTWPLAFLAWGLSRLRSRFRGLLGSLAIACGALALVCAGLLGVAAFADSRGVEAIVVTTSAPVREGPADDFKVSFDLHEGSKVRIVGQDSGYVRIRLSNGLEGWVNERQVPAI